MMKHIRKFNESLSNSEILKIARDKYPNYTRKEDGDYNYWEIDGDKVVFNEYDNIAEWSAPVFKISIEELTKELNNQSNESFQKDDGSLRRDDMVLPDPWTELTGDDLKVFNSVEGMISALNEEEWFVKMLDRKKIEDPIVTEIIDQSINNKNGRYYVFINNFYGKGYIEIETDLDTGGGWSVYPINAQPSSHGWPASYGGEIYSYDRKTGEINYDKNFFSIFLRK